MSIDLQERYDDLLDNFEKLSSAVAGLRRVILSEDPNIAADMACICESFCCAVLDRHPKSHEGGAHE